MASNIASLCVDDVIARIKSLPEFKEKTFEVYDYATLNGTTDGLMFPCLGVVYEGLVAKEDSPNKGRSTNLTCGIFLLAGDRSDEFSGNEDKEDIILLLDKIRGAIKEGTSPTNHKWVFALEIPFDISNRGLGYYQKWKTTVII